jgi:hypothetical protein
VVSYDSHASGRDERHGTDGDKATASEDKVNVESVENSLGYSGEAATVGKNFLECEISAANLDKGVVGQEHRSKDGNGDGDESNVDDCIRSSGSSIVCVYTEEASDVSASSRPETTEVVCAEFSDSVSGLDKVPRATDAKSAVPIAVLSSLDCDIPEDNETRRGGVAGDATDSCDRVASSDADVISTGNLTDVIGTTVKASIPAEEPVNHVELSVVQLEVEEQDTVDKSFEALTSGPIAAQDVAGVQDTDTVKNLRLTAEDDETLVDQSNQATDLLDSWEEHGFDDDEDAADTGGASICQKKKPVSAKTSHHSIKSSPHVTAAAKLEPIDYYAVPAAPTSSIRLRDNELSHVLELTSSNSSQSRSLNTADVYRDLASLGCKRYRIEWVNDNSGLVIFATRDAATAALSLSHPCFQLRPLSQASFQTKKYAQQNKVQLEPRVARPETNTTLARRFIEGHLGARSTLSPDARQKERQQLVEAKEKKKEIVRQQNDVWEGRA